MKTNLSNNLRVLTSAVVAIATANQSFATELSPSSSLQIQPDIGSAVKVAIANPGDQVWIIQRSGDFINWSEVGSWKVHNGNFHATFNVNPLIPTFFRAFYDPSRQSILSTTENALLLPAPSFNYANPILPPSFHVQPIVAQDNMPATNITTD